ncbi:MAG TPA: hypothetical protein VLE91_02060 [Candidatus Saccharimonadales bacterium]|nr:hypothetical protein [Candidatus Saccharimonadales bacterium]
MTQDRDAGDPQSSNEHSVKRDSVFAAVGQSMELSLTLVDSLNLPEADKDFYFQGFVNGIASSQFIVRGSDEEYEADQPPTNAWVAPCGIEVPTFSRGLSVSLLNHRRYDDPNPLGDIREDEIAENLTQAEAERKITREELEEYKSKTVREGPQALFHYHDAFLNESHNNPLFAANTFFAVHMAQGMADGKFSVAEGNPGTEEFKAHLIEGLKLVKRFISALDVLDYVKLNEQLRGIRQMDDATLAEYAEQILLIRVGVVKSPGIVDNWTIEKRKRQLGPREAIEAGKSYLNCDFRDLPLNDETNANAPQPESLAWIEYTTNNWNNNHQLFGRYEAEVGDKSTLQVDYMLDSTHFPAKYGFFSDIEITLKTEDETPKRILLGQEVGGPELVFPIVVAGDLDFKDPDARSKLDILATDPKVKPDVGKVIADVLRISEAGQVERLP